MSRARAALASAACAERSRTGPPRAPSGESGSSCCTSRPTRSSCCCTRGPAPRAVRARSATRGACTSLAPIARPSGAGLAVRRASADRCTTSTPAPVRPTRRGPSKRSRRACSTDRSPPPSTPPPTAPSWPSCSRPRETRRRRRWRRRRGGGFRTASARRCVARWSCYSGRTSSRTSTCTAALRPPPSPRWCASRSRKSRGTQTSSSRSPSQPSAAAAAKRRVKQARLAVWPTALSTTSPTA
mmetsp:Transcript_32210/g.106549  ORF Transcript_32210/g.106549 Transcript_32210/m.106549 type:complete len:242 (-) Transcript_32210:304-1029(-)